MVKTDQAWAGMFVARDASGGAVEADALPVGTLYVDGTANGAAVTITGSGPYKWAVTLPALTAGQRVEIHIAATIDGVATASVIAGDQADTVLASDLAATLGADGAGLTALGDARLANLDATVSSRSTYAGNDTVGTTTLLSRITALLQTKAEADTAHGLLATAASIAALSIPSAATIAAAAWAYVTRTLTQTAASVTESVTGTHIALTRGTRWSVTLTVSDITGWTKLWFGIKASPDEEADTASVLQIRVTVSGQAGLVWFEGAAPVAAANGTITVNSSTSITITVEGAETVSALVRSVDLPYEVKYLDSAGRPQLASSGGTASITADVNRAVT